MRTFEELIEHKREYGQYYSYLTDFFNEEQLEELGLNKSFLKDCVCGTIEYNRENILDRLKESVNHGFYKALQKRGLSSSFTFEKVWFFNWLLQEGLENWNQYCYAYYGLPLFKATALKYGWENPIGDDSGEESYYNETIEEDYD